MSSTIRTRLDETPEQPDSAGVARSETLGRAERRAGAARRSDPRPELAAEVKALLPDELIDELLAGQALVVGRRRHAHGPTERLGPKLTAVLVDVEASPRRRAVDAS